MTNRSADLLVELLTAAHATDPDTFNDTVATMAGDLTGTDGTDPDPVNLAALLVLLVRIGLPVTSQWCAQDGGDWSATAARLRERMTS